MSAQSPYAHYQKLRQNPVCHPAIFSRECFNFEYELPEHLGEIYHAIFCALDPEQDGHSKSLCYLMPREHGKSQAATVVVPTWLALKNPNTRILIMSQTEGQAKGKLREIRDNIERLGRHFGRKIVENNKTELTLDRSESHDVPTIKAAGFNTGVTGGHYSLILFDDIVDWDSQRTASRREKVWQQFQDYLNLGSEGETVYVVVGTRKNPDDLYSELIDGAAWKTTVRAAIDDWSIVENHEFGVITDAGNEYDGSQISAINPQEETIVDVNPYRDVDVLWPERWPLDALLMDLVRGYGSEQGSLVWRRENLNDADALQGQVLSEDMLSFSESLPGRKSDYIWYAGLDPAVEDDPEKAASNDTDYWALCLIAHSRKDEVTYIAELARKRGMTLAQGLDWVERTLRGHPEPRTLLAESQQAQRWFVQEAQERGLPVKKSSSSGSKEERIIDMAARFESGHVKLLAPNGRTEKWQSFISEWANFPTGGHDDRLDSVEICMRNLPDRSGGDGPTRVLDIDPW